MTLLLMRHFPTDSGTAAKLLGRLEESIQPTPAVSSATYSALPQMLTVFASPQARSIQTLRIVSELCGPRSGKWEIRIEPNLRERSFGEWEGKARAVLPVG